MSSPTASTVRNVMTVDVEDYFHANGLQAPTDPEAWNRMPGRVEFNTLRMLQLFDGQQTRATFFVLGWVADRYPGLVRAIHAAGHEVASHGNHHRLVYEQSPAEFEDDVRTAKDRLEQITGTRVLGYRAPSFSITSESWWALDVLQAVGYAYDSSVYPVRRARYGVPEAPLAAHTVRAPQSGHDALLELPPPALNVFGRNVPIAGGGYFRAYPLWLTEWAVRRMNDRDARPAVIYVHPWEIDPEQPRLPASAVNTFRHYLHLSRTEERLRRVTGRFEFGPACEALGLEYGAAARRRNQAAVGKLRA